MGFCSKLGLIVVILAVAAVVFKEQVLYNKVLKGTAPWALKNINFDFKDIPDLSGKVVVVTGANIGLGKSTAKYIAANGATVIMACRSPKKCNAARDEIVSQLVEEGQIKAQDATKVKGRLEPMTLDLSSLKSVKEFAQKLNGKYEKLFSLVLNAGIMHPPFGLTQDGVESQFGVNHLAHFYLTKLLTPSLKAAQPSTVVAVSSNGQFGSHSKGVFLSLEELNDESNYDPVMAYGQSKLCNVLFAQELAQRFKKSGDKIYVNSLNPGAVNTNLMQHWPDSVTKYVKALLAKVPNTITFEPDWAALTQIYASVGPEIIEKGITGTYFVPIADPCDTSDFAKDMKLQKGLWDLSEDILSSKGF